MLTFNLHYTPIKNKNYNADMAGNAWDGYLYVDGWPVTPPRMQQPLPVPDPSPQPQSVPALPSPMQPPTQHQPAQQTHNSESQVNLAQVESRYL
jgi:hypothetical protein